MSSEMRSNRGRRRGVPRRPSHALIVSYLALFAALGGTGAYAAGRIGAKDIARHAIHAKQLARNAVRSRHIKRGQVRSSDVRDGTLRGRDIRPGSIPPSALSTSARRGLRGAPGPRGAQGPAGPLSRILPSGVTLSGAFALEGYAGTDAEAANGQALGAISFGFQLSAAPVGHVIQEGEQPTAECAGTAANPSAAPGHLCVYVDRAHHIDGLGVQLDDPTNSSGSPRNASPYGAELVIGPPGTGVLGSYFANGTWAVTAP